MKINKEADEEWRAGGLQPAKVTEVMREESTRMRCSECQLRKGCQEGGSGCLCLNVEGRASTSPLK
jgi:hypothetical protein